MFNFASVNDFSNSENAAILKEPLKKSSPPCLLKSFNKGENMNAPYTCSKIEKIK
jgi:hypothetical protein